jgi:hypothetical protein
MNEVAGVSVERRYIFHRRMTSLSFHYSKLDIGHWTTQELANENVVWLNEIHISG